MSTLVDADGCRLREGLTMWLPIRWGLMSRHSKESHAAVRACRLSSRVRMRDTETPEFLPHFHEIAFEVDES